VHRPRYVDGDDPGTYVDGYAGVGSDHKTDAIIFGERRWSYAELDAGVNRAANALLEQGLEKGDRVAAYGMNSDSYVLLWLGCSRAGLIHVPVNFHLAGDELLYILN
jgi:fatty-acyl-CoA synthase